jgi:hypothetical protein
VTPGQGYAVRDAGIRAIERTHNKGVMAYEQAVRLETMLRQDDPRKGRLVPRGYC